MAHDITRTRPPETTTDHREPPRRPMAAGHVMIVCLVALAVGFLLNAPGILKTAKGQPLGWKRDIAVAVAQPVADVSHFLHTDRLRAGLQDALGRGGDDDINESSPSPTTLPPSVTTTLPKKLSFSPTKRLRLWTGGDSLGDFPGTSLINAVSDNPAVDVVAPVDPHISTGLARPEVFNWPAEVQDVMDTVDPDAIVISLGSNDNQAMTGDGSNGASFGTPDWRTEYSRRVGGLMDEVVKTGRTLFWIGVPIVRQDNKLESYQYINAVFQEQAALRPGRVVYIDTYNLMKGPDGNYSDYLPNASGDLVLARAPDGTHYTRFGADKIAGLIVSKMNETFDFGTPTATTAPVTTAAPTTTKKK
jgi:uncharacterized protein